jgi:hypothetical protein
LLLECKIGFAPSGIIFSICLFVVKAHKGVLAAIWPRKGVKIQKLNSDPPPVGRKVKRVTGA